MTRFISPPLLLALTLVATAPVMLPYAAPAEELPSDSRIKLLAFDENDIYTLPTRVGYQSYIEFSSTEEVETISVGDRSFWQIIPSGNRLFIRPLQEGVATNMTVITNKHSYQFDLKSASDEKQSIVYVARFTYPEAPKPVLVALPTIDPFLPETMNTRPLPPQPGYQPAPPTYAPPVLPQTPQPVALTHLMPPPVLETPKIVSASQSISPISPARFNYQYTYTGLPNAVPYEVFDDGRTTFFRYEQPRERAPIVSEQEKGGGETRLDVYEKDGYYAIDRVAPTLVLRMDGTTTYVFNEMMHSQP